VRLPPQVDRETRRTYQQNWSSKTFYVRAAILQHLNDLEDYYLTPQRFNKNLTNIPLEEVEYRLSLQD
jgi:RHH-type rel operon transcriptional repressor/antitoxin RelB